MNAAPFGFRVRDRFNKRAIGWLNARVGRGRKFESAPEVLAALGREVARERFDHVVFSGDATMLGFQSEFEEAARLLGLDSPERPEGIAVPGNHDLYLPVVVREGRFEKTFGAWQEGERIDEHTYPFAQRVGDWWLLGANASRPTHWPWDASGAVGRAQLERLQRLSDRLGSGPKILVIHYPLCMANGKPEPWVRRLRDWKRVAEVAKKIGIVAWLCGHRHAGYVVGPAPGLPFPVICVGSATQRNRWAYNSYTFTEELLTIRRRIFSPDENDYTDGGTSEVPLGRPLPDAQHAT